MASLPTLFDTKAARRLLAGGCTTAAMLVAGAAQAAGWSPTTPDFLYGAGSLSFSAAQLGVLDFTKATVQAQGDGAVTSMQDADGFYTQVSVALPVNSTGVGYDEASRQITRLDLSGGYQVTTPFLKSVSSGGSLTVSNLSIDLRAHTVQADISGANGVGSLQDVALWTFDNLNIGVQAHPWDGEAWNFNFTHQITGLRLTSAGTDLTIQSLGLVNIGTSQFLPTVNDVGTLTVESRFMASQNFFPPQVPEPSQVVLYGIGLAALALARARRTHQGQA